MSSAWLSVLANTSVLGISLPAGEYLRPLVAKAADDRANLVRVDDIVIELPTVIGDNLILDFPAPAPGQALTLLYLLLRLDLTAVGGDLRVDDINLVADINAIG